VYTNPLEAYRTVQKTTMSGRELEASVLTQAAMKLKQCRDNWDAADRHAKLADALKYNQMMWTVFQGELTQPEHPLPRKLREDILSLSAFVDKRIFSIMSAPTPDKLTIIIDINLNLAAGLRASQQEPVAVAG
jgi:flagellar biosynthesis activator protein FlaF